MTSLVHPRGSLPRSWGASPSHPRRPCGGGLERRITAWDTMGYHGITWASINRPGASAPRLKRNLHGPLMGCPLKEWLRGNSRCVPLRLRRGLPGARLDINQWLTRGRSEEHTSELQSRQYLVCRLLLEKKKHNRQRERRVQRRLD